MECSIIPSMFENYPDVVGVDALCKMLGGISAKLAYSILQQKKIPSIRIGREYKIAKTDVIAFVTQLSQRPSG